jgi:glutaredoxin
MFTVWSRPDCKFCDAAKALLTRKGLSYTELPLTKDTADTFKLLTNNATKVPQVFYHPGQGEPTKHIGGFTDLEPFVEAWWPDTVRVAG